MDTIQTSIRSGLINYDVVITPSTQSLSCVQLCDSKDYSLPGSCVHETPKARILEWVAISSSGDLPAPGTELTYLLSPALEEPSLYH